ncbi:MAG: RNA 2',3'-cyclic phosphodiesterase [candidate division WOR-3 bacterium]
MRKALSIRAFVAIELPEKTRAEISRLVDRFRGMPVRWVARQNLHLTLVFLGDTEYEYLTAARATIAQAVANARQFHVSCCSIGAFPSTRAARVIWLGIGQGATELSELARRIRNALPAKGFAGDTRPFSPHLTIGRVRSPLHIDAGALIPQDAKLSAFPVTEVTLLHSHLRPSGPVYETLERYLLRP